MVSLTSVNSYSKVAMYEFPLLFPVVTGDLYCRSISVFCVGMGECHLNSWVAFLTNSQVTWGTMKRSHALLA